MVSVRALSVVVLVLVAGVVADAQRWKITAPESFRANAQVLSAAGGAASALDIRIERYTTDTEHAAMTAVLKAGGNDGFIAELKKAPAIGAVKLGPRSVAVRWAREQPQGDSRRIVVVTDEPVFFAGAGAVDAKPTAGYDIAVLEFTVDSVGLGKGTMAPAARVKPGGPVGVEVDDYSGKRVTLLTVTRNAK
jgi:hypothetical protein